MFLYMIHVFVLAYNIALCRPFGGCVGGCVAGLDLGLGLGLGLGLELGLGLCLGLGLGLDLGWAGQATPTAKRKMVYEYYMNANIPFFAWSPACRQAKNGI